MAILRIKDENGNIIPIPAFKGEKVEPFTYEDFTEEQLESLKGQDGKTPIKGTDYFTEADKSEFVTDVINALPQWQGGSY